MVFTEGRNNSYLVQGVFITLSIIVLAILTAGLALPLLLIPIGLFIAENGVEIDPVKNRYRVFGSFYGLRFGKWYPFVSPKEVDIHLSTENFGLGGSIAMTGYLPRMSGKSLTYNVYLSTETGDHLVFESLSYKFALRIAEALCDNYDIEINDSIANKMRNRTVRTTMYS